MLRPRSPTYSPSTRAPCVLACRSRSRGVPWRTLREGPLAVAVEVVMPRLSDSMEEGTILQWLKSVGEEVKRGDELVEIETDKANMTYEATDEGTLIEIVAQEGDTLPIGEVIARVGDAGEVKGDGKPSKKGEPEKEPAE